MKAASLPDYPLLRRIVEKRIEIAEAAIESGDDPLSAASQIEQLNADVEEIGDDLSRQISLAVISAIGRSNPVDPLHDSILTAAVFALQVFRSRFDRAYMAEYGEEWAGGELESVIASRLGWCDSVRSAHGMYVVVADWYRGIVDAANSEFAAREAV